MATCRCLFFSPESALDPIDTGILSFLRIAAALFLARRSGLRFAICGGRGLP